MDNYSWGRVLGRFCCSLVLGALYILTAHDIIPPSDYVFGAPAPCNGGLKEALAFLLVLAATVSAIEILNWTLWQSLWNFIKPKSVDNEEAFPTGGRLLVVPKNFLIAIVVVLILFVLVQKYVGAPDPCSAATFSSRSLLGWLSFTYITLTLANLMTSLGNTPP